MKTLLLAMSIKFVCPFPQVIIEGRLSPDVQTQKIEKASTYCKKVFKEKRCVGSLKVRKDGKIEVDCVREYIKESL